jgi:ferredoxin-nitrate reductase
VHISHKAVEPPGEAKFIFTLHRKCRAVTNKCNRPDLNIFLDCAKRMNFKDKDGNPLLPFKSSEEVFEECEKMSKGRPCDYSGMSYAKLTGGSVIQWPCNEEYPEGKERLFNDNIFFTDIDYTESFGHDMETGEPISRAKYVAMSPTCRAILKTAGYIPGLDVCDDDFPLQFSTGRKGLSISHQGEDRKV